MTKGRAALPGREVAEEQLVFSNTTLPGNTPLPVAICFLKMFFDNKLLQK
jgi:hypothetical protein